jgi:cytochrome P450
MQQAVVVSDPHIASEVLLNVPGIQKSDIVKVLDLVLSGSGHSSLLTASTNAHWQAVRKAVAPAFSTANIRCIRTDPKRSGL